MKAAGAMDWFLAFATVGTAIGTLALALYTYRLAQSTRESVEGAGRLADLANSQLEEVQAQRSLIAEQAEKSGLQAEATRRVADASEASAIESTKARIDAIAPLVDMKIDLHGIHILNPKTQGRRSIHPTDNWYESQLEGVRLEVECGFSLRNIGRSTAHIALNYTLDGLTGATRRGLRTLSLEPKGNYGDVLIVGFTADELKRGKLIGLQLTYSGMLHGEVFDHIQLNGWVTPLREANGVWTQNDSAWVLNATAAQVVRSYPNLETPEEMSEARRRLLNPNSQNDA